MGKIKLVGIDTPFLLAHTVREHPDHGRALAWKRKLLGEDYRLGLCPTVCDEFLHVVTDPRRFENPAEMETALRIVRGWMRAKETLALFPDERSWQLQLDWMREHRFGRKRILDTGIAAVYHRHGAASILTSNARDFHVLGVLEILDMGMDPVARP